MDTKLAENLKNLRQEQSLSKEAMADALGVTAGTVSKWEAGLSHPEPDMIVKIAELLGTTEESLLGYDTAEDPRRSVSEQIPTKCKVCGGDIVNDYIAGTSVCANCGNKWAIKELFPDFVRYSHVIATIGKAVEILDRKTELASADEANLLFKQAVIECARFNDRVSFDLVKICKEGQAKAERLEIYSRGKHYFDTKSYKSAMVELEKVRGYRNADNMIERCKVELESERRRGIPWAVIFSLIIPAFVCIALKVLTGCPLFICFLLFFAGSAGLGYLLYRDGALSLIIKIVSIMMVYTAVCAGIIYLLYKIGAFALLYQIIVYLIENLK